VTPNTPRRGRYLVKNPLLYAWLRARDEMWSVVGGRLPPSELQPSSRPGRILVAVGGHIGDAVIATGVLAEVNRRVPGAEIGVLCASWQRVVFEKHPLVSRVHVRDHWRLNRANASVFAKVRASRSTRAAAIAEIRASGYEMAIDLSSHWPNAASLLHAARVPVRAGWDSGGGGPLYTRALAWTARGSVFAEHEALIDAALPAASGGESLGYALAPVDSQALTRATAHLERLGVRGPYAILHVGAGDPSKEWPISNWAIVARAVAGAGLSAVATGLGERDARAVRDLCARVPEVVDVTNGLGWAELQAAVSRSAIVVSVDTVIAHLAAASGTPSVTLSTGADDPERWRPRGPDVHLLTGGPAGIQPDAVVDAIERTLAIRGTDPAFRG
jgi:ADP-heptose:LPS heptosyltransferase